MNKFIVISLACLALAACSSGPSESDAEAALVAYVQSTLGIVGAGNDATVSDFSLGECKEADGQPGYSCAVGGKVIAMGGRVNQDISGVYTFGDVNGELRVLGRTM